MNRFFSSLILSLILVGCSGSGQTTEERIPAILDLTPNVTNGAKVYGDVCETCHEADGKGNGDGDDDLTAAFNEDTDEELLKVILEGVPRTRMVSQADLSDQELADVFAYVKTLAAK